ncbi:MAG: PAS domain S-box protein [Thermodesulfobacteriota bacterium]|nr:PAS domain S-box protein [Thermodesulfobacteriota bacterium]
MDGEQTSRHRKNPQDLIERVTDYVVAINRRFEIVMANSLFSNAFSMVPKAPCYQVWKGRQDKCEDCLVEKSFADGKIHHSKETVFMKGGREAQVLVKSTPVKDNRGEIIYVLETATDIEERGDVEEQIKKAGSLDEILSDRLRVLEKSEEKYRTVFERSRDAIFITDADTRIVDINQAGVEILGYDSREEVLALKSVFELFEDPEHLYRFQKKISWEGFVTEFETRFMGKDGRVFDVLITSNVIADGTGENIGNAFIIRDITKIRQTQQEIERRNIRLSTLNAIATTVSSSLELDEVLNSTIDEILEILEPDSMRIYLLDEQREVLHLVAHKGHSTNFIQKTHMKRREVGDGLLGQTVLTGETRVVDNFLRSKDPYVDSFVSEGLQSTIYIPLMSKGKPVGVMSVSTHFAFQFPADYVRFLTAIGSQIGMAVENAYLYEKIKTAYKELQEAQEQVVRSEKLASLGKLSATIAHEINNPLAAVLNYIRLMIKIIKRGGFSEERLDDISRYLDTMETETARCGEIVKNLLAFSRQSKTSMETHDIKEIIDKSLTLIVHDLEIKNIRILKEVDSNLPAVLCDFRQIQHVFLNLLSNSSEAMTQGGTLTVKAHYTESDGFVQICIGDTGRGIAREDLEHIFEPFFTTKEEGKGVGLGLSVVYGIVSRHNGSIDVNSEIGKGTVFKVHLPIAPAAVVS